VSSDGGASVNSRVFPAVPLELAWTNSSKNAVHGQKKL
jgi:hypothetical protein